MFAAEGGQRGFLISNDDTYLDAYRESLVNIPKIGAVIRERVADNPAQQALLASLESESNARLGLLEVALNARRVGDEAAVRASFSSHRGRDAMLRVRAILKTMRTTEERLLAQRRDAADGLARLLTAVMLVGLGALAAALYYWIASSREQHAVLATTNESLRAAIAESEAASAQMRQMQKMEAVGQLTGGIAHDFNNMLAVIMGGISLALRRMAKGEAGAEQYLTGALDGAQRASTLVKRLLAFARQQPLEPTVSTSTSSSRRSRSSRRTRWASRSASRTSWRAACGKPWPIPRNLKARSSICASMRATRCPTAAAHGRVRQHFSSTTPMSGCTRASPPGST